MSFRYFREHPVLRRAFYNFHSREFSVTHDTLAAITLISVCALALESLPSLADYYYIFQTVEYVSVGIFTLEYLARLFAAPNPFAYARSFLGMIDLLAILPTYFRLFNFLTLKSARVLRILRFFRLIHASQITEEEMEAHRVDFEDHAEKYRHRVIVFFFGMMILFTILGAVLSLVEGRPVSDLSIGQTFFWVIGGFALVENSAMTSVSTGAGIAVLIVMRILSVLALGVFLHFAADVFRTPVRHHRHYRLHRKKTA